ncbi:hypothetical protein [uncultured Methylovirgula sp.]|uniref:hypothetical protein n=1 Tax=uncultured Methylovirgula sp. TaxID=1285960 RepID=UPI00263885F9|nr:hypothetical protein [uncultured Methylovirgula sp.]
MIRVEPNKMGCRTIQKIPTLWGREQVLQDIDKALVVVVAISLAVMYALFFAIICALLLNPLDPRHAYDPEVDVVAGVKARCDSQICSIYRGTKSGGVVTLELHGH